MCSVNPRHGLTHELNRLVAPTTPKKVAVIGGGAAGMRAAIEAAKRGHSVTLFEKSGVLGGQMLHADYFAFKWPMKNYKEWLIRQLDETGVQVKLNTEATPEQISAEGFDAVLAATGAVASLPNSIQGLKDAEGKPLYKHCWEVWDKEPEMGKHVIIVGGSETGMETAIHLLRNGHDVTMLTRQNCIAHDASRLHYITMTFVKQDSEDSAHEAAEWERYDNFTGIVNANTTKLEGNTVTYVVDGEEHTITGDTVIICGGSHQLTEEALAFAKTAPVFYPIGDCIGAGNIQACNRQAYARAVIL
jgi:NADPH-dependent 2,4-dienoyl-CoA reductase/sulfur reductase-like enzyme